MNAPQLKPVRDRSGGIQGALPEGFDQAFWADLLRTAPQRVLDGEIQLIWHRDPRDDQEGDAIRAKLQARLDALAARQLKRLAFFVTASNRTWFVKVSLGVGLGSRLAFFSRGSVARAEHTLQSRAFQEGLAAVRSLGFLESATLGHYGRSLQIQETLPPGIANLEMLLPQHVDTHGEVALKRLAEKIAQMHRVPFFHADIKGFHAYPFDLEPDENGVPDYTLKWVDLGRAAFSVSNRQRIINLYQCLRFLVPGTHHADFVRWYCHASGWQRGSIEGTVRRTLRFLDYKLRTHLVTER